MLRTGLITFHFSHHYGAQLQAYATMKAIQGLGHECEIIDYRLPDAVRASQLYKKSATVRGMISDAHTTLHYAQFKRRVDRFNAFVAEEMPQTAKRYGGFADLQADPPSYDVYVAGSDQIWNPYIFEDKQFDPSFLLAFAKEGRRISYGPSFAVSELPQDKAQQLKDYLEPFSALSVREKRGQALVERCTGRTARVVLDPTLLLRREDWARQANPPKDNQPYILCYFVSDPGAAASYAKALSERTGLPIVQLAGARRKINGCRKLVFDAGPREFLGLFRNADYVVTNSFHGAVFSLQFGRPFFTSMSPKELANPTDSRIYSLLSRLGCADRIIGLDSTAALDAAMDYDTINAKLEEARADSLSYLKAAVEGTELPPVPVYETAQRVIPTLCGTQDCTGCTACAAACPVGAITMKPDHEGFLRPVVGNTCIHCGKCETVCPSLAPRPAELTGQPVYAVRNRDAETLSQSTSGGFFTVLARHVLAQGGAICGAAYDEQMNVVHCFAENEDELAALRQTKYVQSDLRGVFTQVSALLKAGRKVLFTGTPCQVEGLKRYLGSEQENLLTCDLVCHGVPSPAVYRSWLTAQEQRHGKKAASLLFRDKREGWGKSNLTLTFEDGSAYSAPLTETTYGRGFGSALLLRPSCHRCPCAGHRRPADFTLGDFWGIDPTALPGGTKGGVSMVILNSDRAKALWEELNGQVEFAARPWDEAIKGNPRLLTPTPANPKRAAFFAAFRTRDFSKVEADYLALPSLLYRMAAKVLTPKMKAMIRRIIK